MPVKSIVAWPRKGERIRRGHAHGLRLCLVGLGPIEQVDVSTDGQRTWSPAQLTRGDGPLAWTRWEFDWTPPAAVRHHSPSAPPTPPATSSRDRRAWNKFGYQMNAILTRTVSVE